MCGRPRHATHDRDARLPTRNTAYLLLTYILADSPAQVEDVGERQQPQQRGGGEVVQRDEHVHAHVLRAQASGSAGQASGSAALGPG